ncbi:MAG: hypothetical protein ABW048_13960 [Sphingobium sp.]
MNDAQLPSGRDAMDQHCISALGITSFAIAPSTPVADYEPTLVWALLWVRGGPIAE